jgi:hypothetical protein
MRLQTSGSKDDRQSSAKLFDLINVLSSSNHRTVKQPEQEQEQQQKRSYYNLIYCHKGDK